MRNTSLLEVVGNHHFASFGGLGRVTISDQLNPSATIRQFDPAVVATRDVDEYYCSISAWDNGGFDSGVYDDGDEQIMNWQMTGITSPLVVVSMVCKLEACGSPQP